jgi:hypothetical protein
MRRLLFAVLFALTPVFAGAQVMHNPDIESVIRRQIEAFQADDFSTAFDFASPGIRGIFQTPERFGRMVREGYPMVWRPDDYRFVELHEKGGRLYQTLMVRDGEGRLFFLDYEMIETPDGWQIDGVQLLRMPSVGA